VKKFSDFLEGRCWPGYKPKPGKAPYSPGSCVEEEDMEEDWSQKYKSSIDCNNPKGFSQKAHCAGKKKNESVNEDLRNWFNPNHPKGGWKRVNSKGEVVGDCAREPGEPKPKCMSNAQRASLSKKEKASAVRRKRKEDPNPERQGEPINVKSKVNENMEQLDEKNKPTNPELWSRAIAQAKSKFDVYPSAYANGWASKWYKEHGGGWKSVSEAAEVGDDPVNQGTPEGLTKRGPKTVLKKFKELSMEGAVPSTEKVVTVRHKTSGKELKVAQHAVDSYKTSGYHPVSQVKEAKDEQEYGYEGDMALNQLATLIRCGEMIKDMLKPDTDMPEWVQSKITLATDYIQTAADYMYSEMNEGHQVVATTKQGETFKSGVHATKEKALSQHYKMAKSGNYKKVDTVKTEEVEQIDELSSDLLGRYKTGASTHYAKLGAEMSKDRSKVKPNIDKQDKRYSGILKATNKQFDNDMKKEEVVQEGRPSQRHPLEGHEYHKKSDEALVHIAKDAHAAAEAMKGHNTDAENKYRDQANDSATVRHFRKTSGKPDWYKKKYGLKESFRPMDEPNYNNSIQSRQKKADDANKPPFDGPYKKTPTVVTDKSGAKHGPMSRARDLARNAAKKQAGSMKEEKQKSRKAQIIKDASRGKDKFEKDPIITDTTVKTDNLQ
jgi:hypothetical protein